MAAALRAWPEVSTGRLKVVEADVLSLELASLGAGLASIGSETGSLGSELAAPGSDSVAFDSDSAGAGLALGSRGADSASFGPDLAAPSLGAAKPGPLLVCGNLPYNISTPLLFWYMAQAEVAPKAVFMLQKEMAERLVAKPGGRDYGRLTVAASLWHEVRMVMDVPPEAFRPRPKVHSRVITLTLKESAPVVSRVAVGRFTAAAFHARRKTVMNNLSARYGREAASMALSRAEVDPGARPETLAPEVLASLAAILEEPRRK